MRALCGLTASCQPRGVGDGILQSHMPGTVREDAGTEQDDQDDGGQSDRELGDDGTAVVAETRRAHATVRARRTRSVRMPRTSSERMITTSRPAKATAATVVELEHT